MKTIKTIILQTTLIITCLLCGNFLDAQDVKNQTTKKTSTNLPYLEYLPDDYNTTNKKYPLLIFLHGLGEKGNGTTEISRVAQNGPPMEIKNGSKMTFTVNNVTYSFIVLSPQLNSSIWDWNESLVDGMVKHAYSNYRIDTCKVYLTGLSLGGGGVWSYVLSDFNKVNKFAAIAPTDGFCPGNCAWDPKGKGCLIAKRQIPVWAFHGVKDYTVLLTNEKPLIDGINDCNNPIASPKAIYTLFPDAGHGVWESAYKTTNTLYTPNLYQWMLSNTLKRCGITGTTGMNKNTGISVSSNSIDKQITVSNPASQLIQSYALLNSLGQTIAMNSTLNSSAENINIDLLPNNHSSNLYFLKMLLEDGSNLTLKILR